MIALDVPADHTEYLQAEIISGHWLEPGETDDIVVSNHFMKLGPDVKSGDTH